MNLIEDSLVQNFGANKINGSFLEGLGGTRVFRITKQADLSVQLMDRDIILEHCFFKKIIWGILCLLLLFVPLTIGLILNTEKFFRDMNALYFVFIVSYFLFVIGSIIYNLIGFIYQKNKLKKYLY